MSGNPYRELPSVSELIAFGRSRSRLAEESLTSLARQHLDRERAAIQAGIARARGQVFDEFERNLELFARPRLEAVLNATGVVVHTNLGRAPVSGLTAEAMGQAAANYVPLELDPDTNQRGGRMAEVSALMHVLTGAEATLVVNNNAAAILLVLSALSAGRGAVVSRGEAVEIGGGFRIPDVMRQSGAILVEVGTTNRTYARDYEDATTAETGVYLKVHPSNFSIDGFTASANVAELAEIARRRYVPLVEDLGSGALLDTARFGLSSEPTIADRIAQGVDVLTASGDKLLGGPQAGLIIGRAELVERIEKHPLARAVRADKACLAGVAQTLRHYVEGTAEIEIPVWRMLATTPARLSDRAASLLQQLSRHGDRLAVVETKSTVGGGSLPGQTQPSVALAIEPGSMPVDELAQRLRRGSPRVFGRVEANRLFLDLRTILPEQDDALAAALGVVLG